MRVNGQTESLPESGMSLKGFLIHKGLKPEAVVVERNGEVVERAAFESVLLQEGDALEILRFVGGGS